MKKNGWFYKACESHEQTGKKTIQGVKFWLVTAMFLLANTITTHPAGKKASFFIDGHIFKVVSYIDVCECKKSAKF